MQSLKRVELGGNDWVLAEVGGDIGPVPAVVPGTVHTDLMVAGIIPDPFLETNEKDLLWVLEKDWSWGKSFDVSADILSRSSVELVFEGIDTAATIRLNGREIAQTENMYIPLRIDVKKSLICGQNQLEVIIQSPTRVRDELAAPDGLGLTQAYDKASAYLRKAPYSFSWDWGPELPTSGIWKPVYLEVCEARISDVWPQAELFEGGAAARLRLSVSVDSFAALDGRLQVKLRRGDTELEVLESIKTPAGESQHELEIRIDDPDLWWPLGYGQQPLYELETVLLAGEEKLDTDKRRVGLRSIELVRQDDETGESFFFRVNGEPVFCRGANWIPDDSFLPRLKREDTYKTVALARQAGMNMLRIWGGGVYESDDFYDACDEMGILVWQDFCFACGLYPDHLESFCQSVRLEAEANLHRLRGRTSLALLCGNNECQWGWHVWGWGEKFDRFYGEKLYQEVLPEVAARLAPETAYWPGSPYGPKDDPNSQDRGDMHYWGVWHRKEPAEGYEKLTCRFLSEFGFESGPAIKTIREFTKQTDLTPDSPVMLHHERCSDGPAKLKQYLETEFGPVTEDLALWVYRSQYVQAHCVGTALRHTRRRFPDCGGVLFWQHNDCWPATSWSCIDHRGRPKALWYQARRDFAPVACSLADVDGELSAWICANRPEDAPAGQMNIRLLDFEGREHYRQGVEFSGLDDFRPLKLWSASHEEVKLGDGRGLLLVADYLVGGERIARAVRTFVNCKDQNLGQPNVQLDIVPAPEGSGYQVTVSSDRVVLGLMLTVDGDPSPFEENFLYLLPGETQTVISSAGQGITYLHAGSGD
jgi:beta-mannosidase